MAEIEQKRTGKNLLPWLLVVVAGVVLLTSWNVMFDIKLQPSERLVRMIGVLYPTPTPAPLPTAENLAVAVIPEGGYEVKLNWGETGKKLVAAGGIEMEKFSENYTDSNYEDELEFLTGTKEGGIRIDAKNAYFWVNTLWALGLTQKSEVLDKGVMGTEYRKDLGNFSSTAGWTLGARDAVKLYSSAKIIDLDENEEKRVAEIAGNIYRPCCGNSAAFPDCNHGMAILGLVELMVDQRFSDEEIYRASLAFNAYWFPQTYVDLAYYFQTRENTGWDRVDAKRVLGAE